MLALTRLTRIFTQAWRRRLPKFSSPSPKLEGDVAQQNNQYLVPASLPFGW